MNFKTYKYLIASLFLGVMTSCSDEVIILEPSADQDSDLSGVPSEITDGYSLSFTMSVAPMDGGELSPSSRATNQSLREIENFVDLEKLRILFFTCLADDDFTDEWCENLGLESTTNKYHTGIHDVFLFEAKSRWVSLLSTAEASDASYQVTAPIFSYGNQTVEDGDEDYDWEFIREVLTTRPFKIAILVNRPEQIHYSDFDLNYGADPFNFKNKGPYWGVEESKICKDLFNLAKSKGYHNIPTNEWKNALIKDGKKAATINDLHHCQWDPVYANKNSTKNFNWYDFIISNPSDASPNQANKEESTWIGNGQPDAMGAISSWTTWMTHAEWEALNNGDKTTFADKTYHYKDAANTKPSDYIMNEGDYYKDENGNKKERKPMNFYQLPDQNQGIPMYGVQKFEIKGEWKEGTPIHLSAMKVGQNSETVKKNIMLLRSLARIELIIPRYMTTTAGKRVEVKVTEPAFMASNVFGRCEPMDVATPTDQLWSSSHSSCEWNDIYSYGPIVTNENDGEVETIFLQKMAWFYGAWRSWWDFNYPGKSPIGAGSSFDSYFKSHRDRKPYPRIFNSCIQRNGTARLEFTRTQDDADEFYHYVVYTCDRNINDPSKFSNSGKGMKVSSAELAYFQFKMAIDNGTSTLYCVGVNPYNSGSTIRKNYMKAGQDLKNYKSDMANGTGQNEWNYPIMRNHAYVFRVTSFDNSTLDSEGMNILVVDPEIREANIPSFY